VIDEAFPYFVREMVKLSKQSAEDRRQRQMIRNFAILGATSTPLVSGVLNVIEKGDFAPRGKNPFRWLAKNIAGGLAGGALFPTIRRRLTPHGPREKK
jgi:hypothetical protein